jgi:hypothetical protein
MGGTDSSEPAKDGLGQWFLSLTQTARPLTWLLVSVVLAVGACSWAITNRLAARRADVTMLYARSASHVGQEVEKRVAAYVNVGRALANVTRVQVALEEERKAAEAEREAAKSENPSEPIAEGEQVRKQNAALETIRKQITSLSGARDALLAADASVDNAAQKLEALKRKAVTTEALAKAPPLPSNVSAVASAVPRFFPDGGAPFQAAPRPKTQALSTQGDVDEAKNQLQAAKVEFDQARKAQEDAIPAFKAALYASKKLLADPSVVKQPGEDVKKAQSDLDRLVAATDEVSKQKRSIRSATSGYAETWKSCQAERDPATCFGRRVLPTLSLPKGSRIEVARCVWNDATSVLFDPLSGRVAIPAGEYAANGAKSDVKKADDVQGAGLCLWIPFSELLDKAAPASADDGDLRFAQTLLVDGRTGAALASSGASFVQAVPGFDGKTAVAPRILEKVEIGGAPHRVFLQPVATRFSPYRACPQSTPACNDVGPWLAVVGLVTEARFAKESVQLLPTTYLWAIVGFALAIASWPLAKLWLVGPRSRFRRFDVALLASAAIAATFLTTVAVAALLARNRLTMRTDDQLRAASEKLEAKLNNELDSAADALRGFEDETKPMRRRFASQEPAPASVADVLAAEAECAALAADMNGNYMSNVYEAKPRAGYCEYAGRPPQAPQDGSKPRLPGSLFWADRDGFVRINRVESGRFDLPVRINERGYFQQALEGAGQCRFEYKGDEGTQSSFIPCVRTEEKLRVGAAEVVRSLTSAEKILVLARPTFGEGSEVTGVAAVELSLARDDAATFARGMVLPLGFQAAVVRSDGTVMLHSNLDAHHGHDVFADEESGGELREAIRTKSMGPFDARYLGRMSRAHVRPHPRTGWYIVVFAAGAAKDSAVVEAAVTTAVQYSLFVLALALLSLVAAARSYPEDGYSGFDLRPSAGAVPTYRALRHLFFWASVPATFGLITVGSFIPTNVLSLAVVAILGTCAWRVASGSWTIKDRDDFTLTNPDEATTVLAKNYAACGAWIAVILVVLPSASFFLGSFEGAATKLVQAELDHYRQKLEARRECGNLANPPECSNIVYPSDSPYVNDSVVADFFHADWPWPAHEIVDRWGFLTNGEYHGASMTDRDLQSSFEPEHVSYAKPSTRWEQHTSSVSMIDGSRGLRLDATVPHLSTTRLYSFRNLGLWLLGIVLVGAGLRALVYQSIKRLYHLPVIGILCALAETNGPVEAEAVLARVRKTKKPILLTFPGESLTSDLRSLTFGFAPAPVAAASPTLAGDPEPVALVADLQAILDSEVALDNLEKAVLAGQLLIATSAVDPLRRAPEKLRDRWARVLSSFEVLRCRTGRALKAKSSTDELLESKPSPRTSAAPESGADATGMDSLSMKEKAETNEAMAKWFVPETVEHLANLDPHEARYYTQWRSFDDEERRVLAQIAIDGYTSPDPRNGPTLLHLVGGGFLDPGTLRVRDEGLVAFVRSHVGREELSRWEASETTLLWNVVRVPLLALLGFLLWIVYTIRPEVAVIAGALAPSLGGGIPKLLQAVATVANRGARTAAVPDAAKP